MTAATVHDVETAFRLLRAGYPGYQPEIDDDTLALWQAALSTFTGPVVLAAAGAWVKSEPRMPALAEFLTEARRAASSLALAERAGGEQATETCPECGNGRGMVMVDEAGQSTVRPCSRCNWKSWQRWSGGHYMADHDCQECREVRAGKTKDQPAPAGHRGYRADRTHEGGRR